MQFLNNDREFGTTQIIDEELILKSKVQEDHDQPFVN
jgi:hypothetical protein